MRTLKRQFSLKLFSCIAVAIAIGTAFVAGPVRRPKVLYRAAMEDFGASRYEHAIKRFDRYVIDYPDRDNIKEARILRAICQIYLEIDQSPIPTDALATAEKARFATDVSFDNAQWQKVIVTLARRFVDAAKTAKDIQEKERIIKLAEDSVELARSRSYFPQ